MKKLGLLLLAMIAVLLMAGSASAEFFYVNETAWKNQTWDWNYTSTPIQDAINNASAGDIIIVEAGMYYGGVTVDKSLTINTSSIAYLDCNGSASGFTIAADSVEIYGFNIYNCTNGIYSADTDNSVIKACTIHDNTVGVNIEDGQNNKVSFNNIYNNTNFGIYYGNVTGFNLTTGWYIDGEYNYWYAEKGPAFCNGAATNSTFTNCSLYKVTNVTQGDNVTDTDYTPWLRAKVFDYKLVDVPSNTEQTIDAKDVADVEVKVDTGASGVRVFIAGFFGNPGTDFVTNIGRFAGIEVNDTSAVDWMYVNISYTFDDLYGKQESTAKMYYWNGKLDDYWLRCAVDGYDSTDSGIYTGYVWCNVSATAAPGTGNLTEMMFGPGMYSDPVGGTALPVDKIALTASYLIAAALVSIGVAVYFRRKD